MPTRNQPPPHEEGDGTRILRRMEEQSERLARERHEEAGRQLQAASEQAHGDAAAASAERTARASNPYSLTNIILVVALGFGGWMASQIWSTLQEGQKEIKAQMQQSHDDLMMHSFALTNIQIDVGVIKETLKNVPLRAEVNDELAALRSHIARDRSQYDETNSTRNN